MRRLLLCVMMLYISACGDSSHPSPTPVPTPVPMVCCSGILTWNPNSEVDLAGYHVYRSLTQNIPNPPSAPAIATVTVPTYTDTTGIEGTTYYYVVTAFDTAANESGVSNEVNKLY